ncbi:MFS transporter [Sulfuracidifex metallicus]|uniref:MFS transporter n=1 Tax=Sulfuracidifex metallicus DSM 6482 = JCM 9184 TaxID=523847 RepID=A0A6A9QI06_SULME|nr:MFS transporter [Sulfuracidifex metallicus]MUN28897.1 MFS transporter [Sulfuracidifex metallicus DSM 6482 = JCM 9184]WOE50592.1 MFS transporter [Sulfuracidifex metallicus DSM 6482 = JCM 9184]
MQSKWLALTNTSIAIFMAFANYNMIIIALPAIFSGLNFNPENPSALAYLIWLILGYMVITSTLVVTFGRISDTFGRAKLYTLGFVIFTVASALLASVTATGNQGILELIVFRLLQGVGGGFLMVNSSAVLTDYFPRNELGKALGLNQIAGLIGGIVGLILGGVLSAIDWRFIFLVNVPVGIVGSIWSYLTLKDVGTKNTQKIHVLDNALFGGFLTLLLISATYMLVPYDGSQFGFTNPIVIIGLPVSLVLLGLFLYEERKIPNPMFNLKLFRSRLFSTSISANMIASLVRQGITIMLILLLEGIWLPLHGYSFSSVPFWAGIYLIPNLLGYAVFGPLSGYLSDKFGTTKFEGIGMLVTAIGLFMLYVMPYDFNYLYFASAIFIIGAGMGIFTSPNTADIMRAVSPQERGVASGMRAALGNTASTLSVSVYFIIIISGMAVALPSSLARVGITFNLPAAVALFSALLGYDPLSPFATQLSPTLASKVIQPSFFANAIAPAFIQGFDEVILISLIATIIAGLISVIGGRSGKLGIGSKRVQGSKETVAKRS